MNVYRVVGSHRVALIALGAKECERPLQLHVMPAEKMGAGLLWTPQIGTHVKAMLSNCLSTAPIAAARWRRSARTGDPSLL